MRKGSILGYDLNEKNCQISYYDERKDEPETLKFAAGHYQIPEQVLYHKRGVLFFQILGLSSIYPPILEITEHEGDLIMTCCLGIRRRL